MKPSKIKVTPEKETVSVERLDWNSSNTAAYYEFTRKEFFNLHALFQTSNLNDLYKLRPDIFSERGITNIYENIVHTLKNCALKTIFQKGPPSVRKHWWDFKVTDAKN